MSWHKIHHRKEFDQRGGQTRVTETWATQRAELQDQPSGVNAGSFDRVMSHDRRSSQYTESWYEGFLGTGALSLRAGVSEEPIETHPMFGENGDFLIEQDEWAKYRKWLDGESGWTPEQGTANFQKFWGYKKKGVDSFLAATCDASIMKFEDAAAPATEVGEIASNSELPNLEDEKNWLLFAVSGKKEGAQNKWENTYTYRASGAGGWDSDLY